MKNAITYKNPVSESLPVIYNTNLSKLQQFIQKPEVSEFEKLKQKLPKRIYCIAHDRLYINFQYYVEIENFEIYSYKISHLLKLVRIYCLLKKKGLINKHKNNLVISKGCYKLESNSLNITSLLEKYLRIEKFIKKVRKNFPVASLMSDNKSNFILKIKSTLLFHSSIDELEAIYNRIYKLIRRKRVKITKLSSEYQIFIQENKLKVDDKKILKELRKIYQNNAIQLQLKI